MPLVKGAKRDAKTGKFKMPPGYRKKNNRAVDDPPAPVTRGQKVERNHELVRQTARQGFAYVLFAQYPTGRAYVAEIEEPSFEGIARQWGGGRFEVWKRDRTSGEYVGDPVVYPVDPDVHAPKLPGFATSGPPKINPWAPALGANQLPPWMTGAQAAPPLASKVEELEEELEDLEDENARLKVALSNAERDREDDRRNHERTLQEMARKEEFRAMLSELQGKKGQDPLEMLLSFKRVEAELSGPLNKTQSPMEALQTSMMTFKAMMDMTKTLAPSEGGNGGGMTELLGVVGEFMKMKKDEVPAVINLPAPPVIVAPVVPTEAQKSLAAEIAKKEANEVLEIFAKIAEQTRKIFAAGNDPLPELLTEYILKTEGPEFERFRSVVKLDNPENALSVLMNTAPDITPDEQRQKWIVSAFALAQAKLLS